MKKLYGKNIPALLLAMVMLLTVPLGAMSEEPEESEEEFTVSHDGTPLWVDGGEVWTYDWDLAWEVDPDLTESNKTEDDVNVTINAYGYGTASSIDEIYYYFEEYEKELDPNALVVIADEENAEFTVNGSVVMTVTTDHDPAITYNDYSDSEAYGVLVEAWNGRSAELSVSEDIVTSLESEGDFTYSDTGALTIYTKDEDSEVTVTTGGDIVAKIAVTDESKEDTNKEDAEAYAVSIYGNGSSTLQVGGSISASAEAPEGEATATALQLNENHRYIEGELLGAIEDGTEGEAEEANDEAIAINTITVTVEKDVTATATIMNKNDDRNSTVNAAAIDASTNTAVAVDLTVNGEVSATAKGGEGDTANATAITTSADSDDAGIVIQAKSNISATATATGDDANAIADAITVYSYEGSTELYAEGDVNATATVTGDNGKASANGINVTRAKGGDNTIIVSGSVTAEAVSEGEDGEGHATGICAGIGNYDKTEGLNIDVQIGTDVTATGNEGIGIVAYGSGDLYGSGIVPIGPNKPPFGPVVNAVQPELLSTVPLTTFNVEPGTVLNQINSDNVFLVAEDGNEDDDEEADETEPKDAALNIVVGGTISGSEVAVQIIKSITTQYSDEEENETTQNADPDGVNLTAWAIQQNADNEIARVADITINYTKEDDQITSKTETKVDKEATAAFEARINYIVKMMEELSFESVATEKKNTVTLLDTDYHTANQDEKVAVTVKAQDGKELEGIYYNADDEESLTAVEDLETDDDGNFLIKMLRGGGMLLGLKWHTHTPGDPVKENEVAATCEKDGSYDEVVYCTACKKELSRTAKTVDKLGHTAGDPVKENEVAATCEKDGSYDEVVYCTVCEKEISRTAKTVDKLGHKPGDPVKENEVAATCEKDGSYDEVVYCTVCEKELSRTAKTVDKLGHTAGDPVKEKEVAATCEKDGSYDEVVYCTVCEKELSRTAKTIDKLGHTPGDPVKENEVAATCDKDGSYDEVVYCTACKKELSRTTVTVPATGDHSANTKEVRENEWFPTHDMNGHYDLVTYCSDCGKEISRKTVYTALVFEPVTGDIGLGGLKAEDEPAMSDVLAAIADSNKEDNITVVIYGAKELLTEEEMKEIGTLPLHEQLMIIQAVLGCGGADNLTEDGRKICDSIMDRIANLDEAGKAELDKVMEKYFWKGTIKLGDKERATISIEVDVTKNSVTNYTRYQFYEADTVWKLLQILEGRIEII